MASKSDPTEGLVLSGLPRRMILSSPLLAGLDRCEFLLPAALTKEGQIAGVEARVSHQHGTAGRARLVLPRTTPPGEYKAELHLNGDIYPVTIVVAPESRVSMRPYRLVLEGVPGDTVKTTTTFINKGNVPVEIPASSAVGIYDNRGLENAFASTYRLESENPLHLLGHLLSTLRQGHGGLFKIQVMDGAGTLAPGEERSVRLKANISDKLQPGHSYHGLWPIGRDQHWIGINVQRR
jgi:hypothetical protein